MPVTDTKFNPSESEQVAAIKNKAMELEQVILENTPAGRRRQVALTNLETATMWAVKSVFEA